MTSDKEEHIARLMIYAIAAIGMLLFCVYGCDKQPQLSNAEDRAYRDTTNGPNIPVSFFTNCERLEKQGGGWTEAEQQACNDYGYYLVAPHIPDPGPMQGQWLALPMNRE